MDKSNIKPTVAFFVRKKSQLKASFIKNQIEYLDNFRPVLVYKQVRNVNNPIDGGFANFAEEHYPVLSLAASGRLIDSFFYFFRKQISHKNTKTLEDFLKKNDVKILHFHFGSDAGIFLPNLKHIRIPKIVSFYGYDASGFANYYGGYGKYFLKNRVFKTADMFLAMTKNMKNDLIGMGCNSDKIIVHYYGSDTLEFFNEHDYSPKEFVNLLILCSLVPQKGHRFLLQAFQKAVTENPKMLLKIVGDGPTKDTIKKFVDKNQLSNYVEFFPKISYASAEHKKFFAEADVFIHPSVTDTNGDKEGIPGAIVEAMAAGLPVISTYHAGIPNIIEHRKTGLLVDEWNVDQLKNAIIELSRSHLLRKSIGLAGQDFALRELDVAEKEKELEEIYAGILREY